MAKQEPNNTETAKAEAPVVKEQSSDLVTEIGTLTYPRAVTHFGKDWALAVMHKVAEIGGHGLFEDADFLSPMFGGLAMPSPDKIIKPVEASFAHLPESEFYFQAAIEEYEELQGKAAGARAAINDLYLSVK